ncbi:hypothetical protein N6L26_08495 [Qipengyuania sp. SS22]|uniref:ZIP family metal transporter n=1 Tax=Qipengyuania sp. SS22 TaxID=2979461 RepID=UPI0021E57149|nr:hypothetical protein [Qipengyuania sp. SS22]UYH54099.1 hypothetical protein N6L26_08495 [Qipengyuania sp. SS22]
MAEWRKPPPWLVGGAMHAAAGLATAVAAVELVPRAIERIEMWSLAIGLVCGSLASLGIARLSRVISASLPSRGMRATTVGAYVAVGADLLTDGLMTGSGAAVAASLGILLALSQVIGNLPGGFAIAANFRATAIPRNQRLVMLSAYPLLPLLGAVIGYFTLKNAGDFATGITLAFLAGLLLTATIEEIVPEADQSGAPRRVSSPAFACGFAMLLLLSSYLSA